MAKKGNKRHLKALAAPKFLNIHKKETKYVAKAAPGRHSAEKALPLLLVLKQLGIAKITKDAKKVIKGKLVSVNGKAVRDYRYPVGINDVISINGVNYAVSINRLGKATYEKLEGNEAEMPFKIVRKYKAKGKLMLQLHDGKNINADKFADASINDSLVVALPSGEARALLKLEKDAKCFVIDGIHVGVKGIIKEVKKGDMHTPTTVIVEYGNESFETPVNNIMVIK